MPPKSFQRKRNKPLDRRELKLKKRKQELVHKATVKSRYYKSLKKEDPTLNTPDYVKEIFERTIDEDGNIVEYAADKEPESTDKTINNDTEERVFDLDEASSSDEEEEEEEEDKEGKKNDKKRQPKRHKPNPFKAPLEAFNKTHKLTEEEREKRNREIEEQKRARQKYFSRRKRERGKMIAKTKKGQPNMASQIDVLLGRIKKQVRNSD